MAVILHENINVTQEKYTPSNREQDNDGDYYILSNKVSIYDMEDREFVNGYDMGMEGDYDNIFFGNDWEEDQWTTIGDDDGVTGPPMNDHYNGRHGFKPRVTACLDTIIQCFSSALK